MNENYRQALANRPNPPRTFPNNRKHTKYVDLSDAARKARELSRYYDATYSVLEYRDMWSTYLIVARTSTIDWQQANGLYVEIAQVYKDLFEYKGRGEL